MPFSPQFRRKLNETLGADGAEELVTSMERFDASRGDLAELKQELVAMELRLVERFAREFKEIGEATVTEFKGLREATAAEFKDVRIAIHAVDNKIEQKHAALLMWSFVFWVGAVAAIAVLAGVLRR